jgi:hypothetical protein
MHGLCAAVTEINHNIQQVNQNSECHEIFKPSLLVKKHTRVQSYITLARPILSHTIRKETEADYERKSKK